MCLVKEKGTSPKAILSPGLSRAIDVLTRLDIPAKGRIAHHIRSGRFQRAVALCHAGQQFIWQNARPVLLDQLGLLKQVEMILKHEAEKLNMTLNGEMA